MADTSPPDAVLGLTLVSLARVCSTLARRNEALQSALRSLSSPPEEALERVESLARHPSSQSLSSPPEPDGGVDAIEIRLGVPKGLLSPADMPLLTQVLQDTVGFAVQEVLEAKRSGPLTGESLLQVLDEALWELEPPARPLRDDDYGQGAATPPEEADFSPAGQTGIPDIDHPITTGCTECGSYAHTTAQHRGTR